jgi:hypothetical protein
MYLDLIIRVPSLTHHLPIRTSLVNVLDNDFSAGDGVTDTTFAVASLLEPLGGLLCGMRQNVSFP